jgi:hypothetical protein
MIDNSHKQLQNKKKKKKFALFFISPFLSTKTNIENNMAPVQRPENIATMINGVELYNPKNVQVLEGYLDEQCEKGEYDLEANLAILKL